MKHFKYYSAFVAIVFLGVIVILSMNNVNSKIGVVNTPQLMSEFKEAKEAISDLESESSIYKNNIDTLTVEFEKKVKEFESSRPNLTEKELKLFQELLQGKSNQLEHYKEYAAKKLEDLKNKRTRSFLLKINETIHKYGETNKYDIILGGNGDGSLLYIAPKYDITEEIISVLNEN